MGSEKYPYKGIIDHFANRGFSNGTNAWTDTDHTAYTVSTAGEAGFLQILPIYVDHILYPTISKAGFTTEVLLKLSCTYSYLTSLPLLGASH
jgi:Zn-dependent M16 (insulinase) family peptidase